MIQIQIDSEYGQNGVGLTRSDLCRRLKECFGNRAS